MQKQAGTVLFRFNQAIKRSRLLGSACVISSVFLCGVAGVQAAPTDFAMLPALPIKHAEKSLLLDITLVGQRLVACGEQGLIIYSEDNGTTWQQGQVPVSVTLTRLFFLDAQHGWATGHQGIILFSGDGGKTWVKQLDGKQGTNLIINAGKEQVAALQEAIDANPEADNEDLQTQLDEITFLVEDKQKSLEEGPGEPLLDIWFADANRGFAVGAYGYLLSTLDGGKHWSIHPSYFSNADKFHLYSITPVDANTLYLTGESGSLWRSTNSGQSWQKLDAPYDGSLFGAVATGDGEVLVFGLRGNVYRSSAQGSSWQHIALQGEESLLGGKRLSGKTLVLVGTDGAVHLSADAGNSFQRVATTSRASLSGLTLDSRQQLIAVGKAGITPVPLGQTSH